MKIYGLTGKTGAGKSTVAEKLQTLGFYIIDGDKIARSITEKGKPAISLLANEFGCDIIESDGSLNRKLLASRAFKDKESTAKLNGITHPIIKAEFEKEIRKAETEGFSYAAIDAAALLACGAIDNLFDGVKILGEGELTKKLTVQANAFSASAVEKIEALGGKAEVI